MKTTLGRIAFAVLAAQFVIAATAREITSLTLVPGSGNLTANVAFTAGEAGDSHILYVAYGASNLGDTLYDWANGGGYVTHGAVSDAATGASVALPAAANSAAYFRAFLVKKLETPVYTGVLYDFITTGTKTGSANGKWLITDYYCTGNEAITADFAASVRRGFRPFGARSSDTNSCFEVYTSFESAWSYVHPAPQGETPYIYTGRGWPGVTMTPSSDRTKITLDAKNKRLRVVCSQDQSVSIDKDLIFDTTKPSDYPLCIFASSESPDGKRAVTQVINSNDNTYAPDNSLLYRFYITTNDLAYARYYIPVTYMDGSTTKGGMWDAVNNAVIKCVNDKGWSSSNYMTKGDAEEVDFHAVVPAGLQTKYERVDAALTVGRQITALSVAKNPGTGRVSADVSFTSGAAGESDILYIAWGDVDQGTTLADWGENFYCAGEVADNATSTTVTLPAGKYPHCFRAFLMRRSDLACDSFAEFIMVKDDGKSYIQTDYLPAPDDKYAVQFALAANDADQRIFSGGNIVVATGNDSGTVTEVYVGATTGSNVKKYWRHTRNSGSAADYNYVSGSSSALPVKTEKTVLYYDGIAGANASFNVAYPDLSEQYSFSGYSPQAAANRAISNPLCIFNTGRFTSAETLAVQNARAGSKFYSLAISNVVDNAAVLGRYYLPAKKGAEYGVWEAQENKFFPSVDGYAFATTNEVGEAIAPVSFLDAVPDESIRRRYYTQSSTLPAERKRDGSIVIYR